MGLNQDNQNPNRAAEAITFVVFAITLWFYQALAIMLLWRWFAVPLGATSFGFATALAVPVFITLFARSKTTKPTTEEIETRIKNNFYHYTASIIIGYVLKGFL